MVDMNKIFDALRLNDSKGCVRNIWFSTLLIFLVVGINYSALVFPLWLIVFISVTLLIFSFISLIGYAFWLLKSWNLLSGDSIFGKIVYFTVLGLVNLIDFYIVLKVISMLMR